MILAYEWDKSTISDLDMGKLAPGTIDAQVHENLTQIDVTMTHTFHVESRQVSRFIYLKLSFIVLYYLF